MNKPRPASTGHLSRGCSLNLDQTPERIASMKRTKQGQVQFARLNLAAKLDWKGK